MECDANDFEWVRGLGVFVAAPLSFHADAAPPEDAPKLRGAPGLGEHNVAVMEELGLSAEQIDGLQRAGVLSTESNSPRRL